MASIANESPADGSRWAMPHTWVEFDAVDGVDPIDPSLTEISLDGVQAWTGGAAVTGFEGSCVANSAGYHYMIRPVVWSRPSAPTVVVASVEDTGAGTDSSSWTFAEWGADGVLAGGGSPGWSASGESGRSEEYRRMIDSLLPPGAFRDEP